MMRIQKGFTLIELMLSTTLIGILSSIALPKLSGIAYKAKVVEVKVASKTFWDKFASNVLYFYKIMTPVTTSLHTVMRQVKSNMLDRTHRTNRTHKLENIWKLTKPKLSWIFY